MTVPCWKHGGLCPSRFESYRRRYFDSVSLSSGGTQLEIGGPFGHVGANPATVLFLVALITVGSEARFEI